MSLLYTLAIHLFGLLARIAARLVEQHIHLAPRAGCVKRILLFIQQRLQRGKARGFHILWNLAASICRRRAGTA